ncbi:MAG: hypothetical protein AAB337_02720 [Patescibacteria group bacterium]
MIKNIFFIVLVVASATMTFWLFGRTNEDSQTKQTASLTQTKSTTQGASSDGASSQEKSGIEITISDVKQADETTTVSLVLDNHQYNLAEDVIYEKATLNGKESLSHSFLANASGGHHAEVSVVFPKATSGSLIIAPIENAVFTFDDLWK